MKLQQLGVKLLLTAVNLQPLFYIFHSISSNENSPLPPKQVSLGQSTDFVFIIAYFKLSDCKRSNKLQFCFC